MSYQKCPICDGSGTTYSLMSNSTSVVCETCKGTKIISMITGLPPKVATLGKPDSMQKFTNP